MKKEKVVFYRPQVKCNFSDHGNNKDHVDETTS